MNKLQLGFLVALIVALPMTTWAAADSSTELSNLIDGGKVDLSFRYRTELVEDDNFRKDANASTLRTRLSLQSGDYQNFDFFAEVDDVREVFSDNFNQGAGNTPSRGRYPVVADPDGTEVNQAYLDYSGIEDVTLRFGRQRINFDNQRFIGGVGWRQNEQTYDGFRASYKPANKSLTADYAYITKVHRIFGEDVPAGDHKQDGTHLLNVAGKVGKLGKVSGYYYLIDNDDAAAASTSTLGVRWVGNRPFNEQLRALYTFEYASQRDAANNPVNFSANYWNAEVGLKKDIFNISVGWEVLSGDAGSMQNEAFRTPLATLHAFNGWADKFLGTPAAGLDDKYVKFKATPGAVTVQARYHQFDTEDGSNSLGDELDIQVAYKYSDKLNAGLYFAMFDGDGGISDTDKLFLQVAFAL